MPAAAKGKKAKAPAPGRRRRKADSRPAADLGPAAGARKSPDRGDLADMLDGLLATVGGTLTPSERAVYGNLVDVARDIQRTRAEIAALRPDEMKDSFLPTAADELDGVIEATADATNAIMDATESIEDVIGGVDGEVGRRLANATTRIYEACGFQDITGQRITKVVGALKQIETRVDGMMATVGDEIQKLKAAERAAPQKSISITDESLLNGPQRVGVAATQAEIDSLLDGVE
jgi:chemotaxis protein CheZ